MNENAKCREMLLAVTFWESKKTELICVGSFSACLCARSVEQIADSEERRKVVLAISVVGLTEQTSYSQERTQN